ncbi:MAG: DUF882 domain-containing protein [Gammaproteobacteria bacterium]|nr:DUF882 domain-containing protein [Gammaproteobacteria bacterium]
MLHSAGDTSRTLSFYHTHTKDRLIVTYAYGKKYKTQALEAINDFLKDFRDGAKADIDPALLDFLFDLREQVGSSGTYEVISAYRSTATNEMLRARSNGVARHSQHVLGKAIDVRLDDVDTKLLRDKAIQMQRGGVGYYRVSNFVHIDTGRVRRW